MLAVDAAALAPDSDRRGIFQSVAAETAKVVPVIRPDKK